LQKVSDLRAEVHYNPIDEILDDIRAGRMVVMMDDEDRENEGDLVMAATMVKAEDINFMARFGRGLICLTLNRQRCKQLRLPLMVTNTDGERSTNFTVSIEAAEGVTTGISAHDRAHTIKTAVAMDASPEDLRQPGHIFPLMALTRLAGLEPAAVIVEILNEDGSMARRPDLVEFARRHQLKIGTIADLIRYRLQKEESVERISDDVVETEFGQFRLAVFEDHVHQDVHLALIRGEIEQQLPLVRVQLMDTLRDVIGIQTDGGGWQLRDALRRIADDGCGVVVILRGSETPRDLMDAVERLHGRAGFRLRDGRESTVLRTHGIGAQILRNLGVHRMRVLSAPKQMSAISGFGLEVVEYVD
jgi:3,4-dihydroxy 2-butanone 4-phosphate synthase/GTP cyclohydrolase II